MDRYSDITNMITRWDGSFDELVKHFTNEDYSIIMDETNWYEESYIECYAEAYNNAYWSTCLSIFLEDWLKEQIYSHTHSGTQNLFRLWFESI